MLPLLWSLIGWNRYFLPSCVFWYIYICILPSDTYMQPSDTLRTWNMVPHPRGEMLSSMNSSNKQRNRKWEKTQKPKIRLVIYNVFSLFYQKSNMILWSIRTFWYKGSAENKKKKTYPRQNHISQKQLPKTKSVIFRKKLRYDVERWVLVRYDIILNI